MPSVTIPRDFFRKELSLYQSWRDAFARELLQNASDAHPSSINVTFEDLDGFGRVTFADDGDGMTRQTLEEVFFALGKTTKTGPDSIGGFGRARIILCFAQRSYTIRTGNFLVEGSGGEYTIREMPTHQRGCTFTIDLIDDDTERVARAFRQLLRTCTMTVPVTLDGVPATSLTLPKRATRVLRDENNAPWSQVYVAHDFYGRMLVRVHGLVMFTRWIDGQETIILELNPHRSRDVLSANRDQLHEEYADQVNRFISDLSQNRQRALNPPVVPLDVRVGGGGFLVTDAGTSPVVSGVEAEAGPAGQAPVSGDTEQDRHGTFVGVQPANAAAYTNLSQATLDLDLSDWTPPAPRNALGFDVFMSANSSDARVRRLARTWDPTGWDDRNGKRRRALLLSWKEAVSIAMDTLIRERPGLGRVMWTVGWVFSETTEAVHFAQGQGHVLQLNPVDATGATKFRISQRGSRQRLLALALHEVTHVVVDTHDEAFAGLLTDLMACVDMGDADRRIRVAAAA